MIQTHKFRLYPTKEQEEKLLETLHSCRFVYNSLLKELNNQKKINENQLQHFIVNLKEQFPELKHVYSKTLQYECYRLFSNLKSLSKSKEHKRKIGKLRFKGKNWFKTFTYNQSGFKLILTGKRYQILHSSKISDIYIKCHRSIKNKIKQVTIKLSPSGKWFILVYEESNNIKIHIKPINKVVGIDLGLKDITYDSDGNKISNPKYIDKHAERFAKEQRKLSKKEAGSKNRLKQRIKVAKQYEKLVNIRDDFLHKLSRYYVDNYDAIALENININNITKKKYISKYILDASWGKLRRFIAYKAESAGKLFITVNHRGTTQRCSKCGKEVKKELRHRTHKCPYCNFIAPRDYNSALEIKKLCLQKIGQELSESTLVEMKALPNNWQLSSMKQEAIYTYL